MNDVRDFVSVEEGGSGFDVVVWTADGDREVLATYRYETKARALEATVQRALATWPGWANPHLDQLIAGLS